MKETEKLARDKRIIRYKAKYSDKLMSEISQKALTYAVELNKENFSKKSWWHFFAKIFKNKKLTW